MLYIVVALKSEAQAFVDYYPLKKQKLSTYTTFTNENITLIISGVGVSQARNATQTLLNNFDITPDDYFLNIGVCGAQEKFAIGSLLHIQKLYHHTHPITLSHTTHPWCLHPPHHTTSLYTLYEPCKTIDHPYSAVDMEAFGFFDAVHHNPAIQQYGIYKVVSDHFQPYTLSKDMVKSLLFHHLQG